ncbi:hypothetical protein EV132_13921 [Rhizobium sullae]|uniref:Uncharacterized protein n=1 Tax=Rhizobium sullae TaxID=50338 RepID=A0A4R3PQP9_RHISU|nr:hypothetical protein EV132_13921 [Rhizobium sullae]
MGIRGLLVHAISEEAKAFYEHYGFIASPANPLTLVMSLKSGAGREDIIYGTRSSFVLPFQRKDLRPPCFNDRSIALEFASRRGCPPSAIEGGCQGPLRPLALQVAIVTGLFARNARDRTQSKSRSICAAVSD